MAKRDIINVVSAKTGVDVVDTEKVMDAFLEYIKSEIVAGRSVVLTGFGSFRYKELRARKGINPFTGEHIDIASGARVAFKSGIPLVRAVRDAYKKRHSGNVDSNETTESFMEEVLAVPARRGRSSTKVVIKLPKEIKEKLAADAESNVADNAAEEKVEEKNEIENFE